MREDRKRHPGLPYPGEQLCEAGEDVGRGRNLLALETPQREHLHATDRVHARPAVLQPAHMDKALLEVELIPAQPAQLADPEHVPVAGEDHGGVAMAVAPFPAPRRPHQQLDLAGREVLA